MFVIHIGGQPPDQGPLALCFLSIPPLIPSPPPFSSCTFSLSFPFTLSPSLRLLGICLSLMACHLTLCFSRLFISFSPYATLGHSPYFSSSLPSVCLFTSISLSTLHCFSPHLLIASDNKGSEFHRNPALKKHSFQTVLNDPVMTVVFRVVPLSNL